jgi:hypothetical protein
VQNTCIVTRTSAKMLIYSLLIVEEAEMISDICNSSSDETEGERGTKLAKNKTKTALVSSSSNTAGGRLFYMLLILRLFVSCSSCGKKHADIAGIVIVSTSVVSSF